MPDSQEDDLPQVASLDSGDFFRIVENQATTPVSSIVSRAIVKTYFDTLYEPIGGGGTGWQTVTETWTRTGNHTFTVATDLTAKYGVGTKVRYKDGGAFEYGVIISSAYSSPNTTVTLLTNTNYLMAAATITDTAISYSVNPQSFPTVFDWSPTWTGVTVGNGTVIAKCFMRGAFVWFSVKFTLGSTSAITSTVFHSIPAGAPVVANPYFGQVRIDDASPSVIYTGVVSITASSVFPLLHNAAATYTVQAVVNATAPITFTTSDIIYEVAEYLMA